MRREAIIAAGFVVVAVGVLVFVLAGSSPGSVARQPAGATGLTALRDILGVLRRPQRAADRRSDRFALTSFTGSPVMWSTRLAHRGPGGIRIYLAVIRAPTPRQIARLPEAARRFSRGHPRSAAVHDNLAVFNLGGPTEALESFSTGPVGGNLEPSMLEGRFNLPAIAPRGYASMSWYDASGHLLRRFGVH